MTFVSLPFNRKSPFGFGIRYIILTFCRCGVAFFIRICILLRGIIATCNDMFKRSCNIFIYMAIWLDLLWVSFLVFYFICLTNVPIVDEYPSFLAYNFFYENKLDIQGESNYIFISSFIILFIFTIISNYMWFSVNKKELNVLKKLSFFILIIVGIIYLLYYIFPEIFLENLLLTESTPNRPWYIGGGKTGFWPSSFGPQPDFNPGNGPRFEFKGLSCFGAKGKLWIDTDGIPGNWEPADKVQLEKAQDVSNLNTIAQLSNENTTILNKSEIVKAKIIDGLRTKSTDGPWDDARNALLKNYNSTVKDGQNELMYLYERNRCINAKLHSMGLPGTPFEL